jgi:hypothetical protein
MIDICKCDVRDKEILALFRKKLSTWKKSVLSESLPSISHQIWIMLWDDAVFRMHNEARRICVKQDTSKTGLNMPIIRLFDKGFVFSQVMAIRRLTDPGFWNPKKAVYSLPTIIKDMKDNLSLITRENYVCYDGISYNMINKDISKYVKCVSRHKKFDKLAGIPTNNRSRQDKIKDNYFKNLLNGIKKCEPIRTYANKFVAHASDPDTKLTEEQRTVTLNRLDDAYQVIIRVALSIGEIIDEHIPCEVPTPQFDIFENLYKPIILKRHVRELRTYWDKRVNQIASWR